MLATLNALFQEKIWLHLSHIYDIYFVSDLSLLIRRLIYGTSAYCGVGHLSDAIQKQLLNFWKISTRSQILLTFIVSEETSFVAGKEAGGWWLLYIFRHCPQLMHINGTCQCLGCQRKCFENIIIIQDLEVARLLDFVEAWGSCQLVRAKD